MRSNESDKLYKTLFELSPDGIATSDIKGVVTSVNPAFMKLTGFSKEELVGKHITQLGTIRARDLPKYLKLFTDVVRGKIADPIEFSFLRKDGILHWGECRVGLIKEEGKTVGIQAILRDITEQKKTLNALSESEGRFRNLADLLPSGVFEVDLNGTITYSNHSCLDLFGYTREDFENGITTNQTIVPEEYKKIVENRQRIFRGEQVSGLEYTALRKDGTTFPAYVHSAPILQEDEIVGLRGIIIDVTERKKTEEALVESEARYRSFVENFQGIAYRGNKNFELDFFHGAVNEITGYLEQDFVEGKLKWDDIIYKTDLPSVLEKVNQVISQKIRSDEREFRIVRKDGTICWVRERIKSIINDRGDFIGVYGTIHDIDALKKYSERLEELVEEKTDDLKESEERLSEFMKSSPDGFFIFDSELNYVDINDVGMALFPEGTEKRDVIGKNIVELALDIKETGRYFKYLEVLQTGKPFFIEDIVPHPTFGNVHLNLRAFKVGNHLGIITTDITKRKLLDQQLSKAKRMATIGETAGMVGHDLRNPLQAIVNTIYLANMKVKSLPDEATEKGELKVYLNTVERQVNYMNKIVSDLLDYARPIHPDLTEISMHQLIQSTLLSLEIPETIEVSVVVPKKMTLKVDPVLMRRVLINLITNSVQAMADGGKLMIKASKKREELLISVKDTGIGIRKEDLSKLFQPLFTTKSKGQGFGLPVCKRIIDAHNGEITVKSKVGKGSTFTLKIPLGDQKN